MVRPANGFVTEGKRTKHAEFGYMVTKLISSDARDSSNRFVQHISHIMTIHQTGVSVPFGQLESFEHAQNLKPDETDITGHRWTSSGFTR